MPRFLLLNLILSYFLLLLSLVLLLLVLLSLILLSLVLLSFMLLSLLVNNDLQTVYESRRTKSKTVQKKDFIPAYAPVSELTALVVSELTQYYFPFFWRTRLDYLCAGLF